MIMIHTIESLFKVVDELMVLLMNKWMIIAWYHKTNTPVDCRKAEMKTQRSSTGNVVNFLISATVSSHNFS